MAKSASKEIKAIEKLNSDLAKVRSHVKEIIFGQDEVIDKIIIKANKIYFGALDVIENILFGSNFFNI